MRLNLRIITESLIEHFGTDDLRFLTYHRQTGRFEAGTLPPTPWAKLPCTAWLVSIANFLEIALAAVTDQS